MDWIRMLGNDGELDTYAFEDNDLMVTVYHEIYSSQVWAMNINYYGNNCEPVQREHDLRATDEESALIEAERILGDVYHIW